MPSRIKNIACLVAFVAIFFSVLAGGCQPAAQAPQVQSGGELHLYGIDPITLDPAVSGEMTSHVYIAQLFGGLVRLDDDLRVVPDIAKNWEISSDGRTYTFHLREYVFFHNGRQVKAGDFKYSWERACLPVTGSRTAATYLGDIVGVSDMLAGRAKELSGVKIVDDYTLQVTIDAPKSYFLSKLTYPTSYVVDRENVATGKEWWRKPNGTGAFKLKSWDKEKELVLERNDRFYGEKAKVSRVVFLLWGGVPMNLYETDEIDVTAVHIDYIDKVTDKRGRFYQQLEIVPELSFSYIGFNVTRPPFNDPSIRRAFSLAIDKDKIISLVYKNMVTRADGVLPPGIPGYNEQLRGLRFDVAEAKRLIATSSYGSVSALPSITITTSGWGGLISQDLEAIINEWRRNLEVEVKVRQLEPERYFYWLIEEKDEMYSIGWVADYPHPQDFLDVLFHSGAENNYGEYSNVEVDALIEKANVERTEEASLALYRQAEQKLVDDAACIPLWFGKNYVLVKPYVEGYKLNPMGFANLNTVSVKPRDKS
jgi:oligopeptide transport system substrate-binding protein